MPQPKDPGSGVHPDPGTLLSDPWFKPKGTQFGVDPKKKKVPKQAPKILSFAGN
jgi:hypothetical protein